MSLNVGLKGKDETLTKLKNSALEVGSGSVAVFATPMLVALMESASIKALEGALGEGESTVGTKVDIRHLAPTPLGMKVKAEAELIEIDRRRLVFKVEAFDEKEKVGEGLHERFIINLEKFTQAANSKTRV
ncbi:MAG: thioesterase family protein [Dethiobacteria bacterium]|jgi:fluoroacetyl-CoA thioesterase